MNPKFVVSHLDQQMGPFTEAELKAKWAKGELLPIDYVYDETKKDWILLAERFEWSAGPGEGSPPPLKPHVDKKKIPPAPVAHTPAAHKPLPNMSQQKPAESTIVIHAPILNVPGIQAKTDPMPTPTVLPVMHQQAKRAGGQPAKVKIVNGIGEIDLSPDTPGHVELVLQDSSNGNLKLQEPLKIQVRPLEPEEITWSFPEQHTVGNDLEIHFKAVDGKGTVCSHFNQDFTLRVAASEPRLLTVHMSGGSAVLKLANTKAEKWHFNLEYVGERDLRLPKEKGLEWLPGPAARLILDGPPDLVAGNPLKVQVRAVDQYGNLASTFQGTVVLEVKAG